jgi:hypothetical protein
MRFNVQPIWIHGGGFVVGAASDYNGSKLAFQGKLMVATVKDGVAYSASFRMRD